jgi:hypothetical protein
VTTTRPKNIECRFASADDLGEWEEGRAESSQADFFNSSLLLRAIHRHLFPLAIVECRLGGRLIGGCFGWDRRMGRRRRLQTPPTLAHGTLWLRDAGLGPSRAESLARDVVRALTPFLTPHFDSINLQASPEFLATMWFESEGWEVRPLHTYRFPMTDVDTAWKQLESSRRRQVNLAREEGMTVEPSMDVGALEVVMVDMLRRRGAPHPSLRSFLEVLLEDLSAARKGQLFVARDSAGGVAAALVVVWEGDHAAIYIGAGVGELGRRGANSLLHWHVIEALCREGRHRWLDLYGWGLPEIALYKKEWNAPLAVCSDLLFTADPRLRLAEHTRGLWTSVKHLVRGKRFGGP